MEGTAVKTNIYAMVMAALVVLGFVVNIGSIVLLSRKKRKSMFHALLKILAVYDLFVMLGCCMLYSLPELWSFFAHHIYPHTIPFLVPAVQIAMMTSIYCTIVMSFERYIRICHLCQLKSSRALTEDNFWIYVTGFLVCPILFYLPKFFEIETHSSVHLVNTTIDCSNMRRMNLTIQGSSLNLSEISFSANNNSAIAHQKPAFPRACLRLNFSDDDDSMIRNFTREFKTLEIKPTALRENKLYYKIYCIFGNTIFASVVPLLSLIYLNICTVLALHKMGQSIEIHETPCSNNRNKHPNQNSLLSNQDSFQPNFSVASEGKIEEMRPRMDTVVVLSRSFSSRVMQRVGMGRSRSHEDADVTRVVTRAVARNVARDVTWDVTNTKDVDVLSNVDVASHVTSNNEDARGVTRDVTRNVRRSRIAVEDGKDKNEEEDDEDAIKELFLEAEEEEDFKDAPLVESERAVCSERSKRWSNDDQISQGQNVENRSVRIRRRTSELRKSICRRRPIVKLQRNSGIEEKLDYLADLNIGSLWISPFYHYGGVDMGYDWINHTHVDPRLGDDEQMDSLLNKLKARDIKAILGFIPNHTSRNSSWFEKSEANETDYADYYIWRPSKGVDVDTGLHIPPNKWESSVPGQSAWTYSDKREMFYLHNFLPEQPDLNLENPLVQQELEAILRFWLEKPAVYGFRISGFNVLFEDFKNPNFISSDINKTSNFFERLRRIAAEYAEVDGIQRLWMLDMRKGSEGEEQWQDIYRNETMNEAIIPFSFGFLPWGDILTGDDVNEAVLEYEDAIPQDESDYIWACWEMGNHDMVTLPDQGYSRIPSNLTQSVMMMSLMLPGSAIVYYGDEIGMFNADKITCEDTQDPYAKPDCVDFAVGSRDQARTPMQWNSSLNAGFSSSEKTWLPVGSDYEETNVEKELLDAHSDLKLFKRLMALRSDVPIYEGNKYFPYHNKDIFSFLRKADDGDTGYLVVVNIHGRSEIVINFADVMPGFPVEGTVLAATSLGGQEPRHPEGTLVDLTDLHLSEYEGLVITMSFVAAASSEH